MKVFTKKVLVPIVCVFTLLAGISPFNLHTLVETITDHPIGQFWTTEHHHHSDSDHHKIVDHRHSPDPAESDPLHECSKVLVLRSESNSISEQLLQFERTLWVFLDQQYFKELECSPSVLPMRIDTGPPNSITLSILSRSCPETAPPLFV